MKIDFKKIENLKNKINNFFELSENTQNDKQDKLEKIIKSLRKKKRKLKKEIKHQGIKDKHCEKFNDLCKEFKVISKLIKKAKKRYITAQDEN